MTYELSLEETSVKVVVLKDKTVRYIGRRPRWDKRHVESVHIDE